VQNNPIKTIFVCEFITAGGFHHQDLPHALVEEGALMRDALLEDLSLLGYAIHTTVDARLAKPLHCHQCETVQADDDVWAIWRQAMIACDAVWVIAPETDGYLEKMTTIAETLGKTVIGCDAASIKIFSDKFKTYALLKQFNIDTIPSYRPDAWQADTADVWVLKPNDGAGCEATMLFTNADLLTDCLANAVVEETHTIQPYIEGDAASISCLVKAGKAYVISCNAQLVDIESNQLQFKGCVINGMQRHWPAFEDTANQIAALFPTLNAYIGIDVLVREGNVIVVEVNPRLTTSYAALHKACSHNPAKLILDMTLEEEFTLPALTRHVVQLTIRGAHA